MSLEDFNLIIDIYLILLNSHCSNGQNSLLELQQKLNLLTTQQTGNNQEVQNQVSWNGNGNVQTITLTSINHHKYCFNSISTLTLSITFTDLI